MLLCEASDNPAGAARLTRLVGLAASVAFVETFFVGLVEAGKLGGGRFSAIPAT